MALNKQLAQEAATMAQSQAHQANVPEGLVWGTWVALHPNAKSADREDFKAIAHVLAATHAKTGKWDTGVLAASGGRVTDKQATEIQARLPVQQIWMGHFPGESFWDQVLKTVGMSAIPLPGVAGAGALGGEAATSGEAAGAGAAGGAGAGAAGAEGAAAGGVLSGLTSKLLAGGLLGALVASVSGYGTRLLEIIAGGVLVLFGLVTLAKGGEAPKLPAVVPV